MRLSDNGRTLIKGFEGLSLEAYPDAAGYSIGYGHFIGKDPSLASRVITRAEADRLFDADVVKFELGVSLATPNASQHEFDAMTSLAYNIGLAGFTGSTVARLHNEGDRQGAADAFRMWNKARVDGQRVVHTGLVKRRERERAVYLHGYSPPGAYPSPLPEQSTEAGWPPFASTSLPAPRHSIGKVSAVSLFTLALGWVVYRLVQH